MADKKKRQVMILIGIFVILLLCYMGVHIFTSKQEKKSAEEAEANKIYMTDISDVVAIQYYGGTDTLSFSKNEDGDWKSVDDEQFPLNSDTVESIISTYSKLAADRKLTDGDQISDYGLDQPTYYVTMEDGKGNKTTVDIGNETDDGYYAMIDGTDTVYTIASDCVTDLQTPLSDMAQLDTFPKIGSGNIVSETVQAGGETTEYQAERKQDSESIATVVGGLSVISLDTPVDYHVADANLSNYGLDDTTRMAVTVVYKDDKDDEQTVILYIGNEDENGNRYVQLDGSKIVYTVTTEICNNILNESNQTEKATQ